MHPHGRQPVSVGMAVIRATLPPHPSSVRVSRSRGLKPRWCAQVQRVHSRNTISSQPGGLPRQWLPGHPGRSGHPWPEEKQGVKYNRILTYKHYSKTVNAMTVVQPLVALKNNKIANRFFGVEKNADPAETVRTKSTRSCPVFATPNRTQHGRFSGECYDRAGSVPRRPVRSSALLSLD